jgi:GH24 family phage-related lysozyme (muramidase)
MSMPINRRTFIGFTAACVTAVAGKSWATTELVHPLSSFETSLKLLQTQPALTRGQREELTRAVSLGLERAPIRLPKSKTPISSRASDLIVACEVTSQSAYSSRYTHAIWPRGESGATIGIGYDIGYSSPDELTADWSKYIPDKDIAILAAACHKKGAAAKAILQRLHKVSIPWSIATKQFYAEAQPRYVRMTEQALPNTGELGEDSLGALVSLVYNRGTSFHLLGSRYQEMRNIRAHMAAKDFKKIPGEILSMRRIWKGRPDMRGVVIRRTAEAALFKYGLEHAKSNPS